jgi:hypothetical protein
MHLPGYEQKTGSSFNMIPMNATHSVDLYHSIELKLGLAMESLLAAAVSDFGRHFAGAEPED